MHTFTLNFQTDSAYVWEGAFLICEQFKYSQNTCKSSKWQACMDMVYLANNSHSLTITAKKQLSSYPRFPGPEVCHAIF